MLERQSFQSLVFFYGVLDISKESIRKRNTYVETMMMRSPLPPSPLPNPARATLYNLYKQQVEVRRVWLHVTFCEGVVAST